MFAPQLDLLCQHYGLANEDLLSHGGGSVNCTALGERDLYLHDSFCLVILVVHLPCFIFSLCKGTCTVKGESILHFFVSRCLVCIAFCLPYGVLTSKLAVSMSKIE